MNDEQARKLIKRMAMDDQEALMELYMYYRGSVTAFLFKLGAEPQFVDELVQDVFLAAWQGADKFKAESSVMTWLLAIAKYKALSHLRSSKLSQQSEKHMPIANRNLINLPDPSDLVITQIAHQELIGKIDQLPSHYQEALKMF